MSPIVIAPVTTLVGLGLFERGFPGVIAVSSIIYCFKISSFRCQEINIVLLAWHCVNKCVNLPRLQSAWKLASQLSWSYCSSHRYLCPLMNIGFTLIQLHQTTTGNYHFNYWFLHVRVARHDAKWLRLSWHWMLVTLQPVDSLVFFGQSQWWSNFHFGSSCCSTWSTSTSGTSTCSSCSQSYVVLQLFGFTLQFLL